MRRRHENGKGRQASPSGTPTGAYSVPPGGGVVRAYAAAREPGLLDSEALPGRSFWPAFGSWLAARRWLAPEQGPAAMEQALRAFVDGLAEDLLPDELTLADLYRTTGRPLDAGTWRRLASPRVTAHPEAQPIRTDSVVELPVELSTDPAWSALGDARRRIGEDARRILIATIATGFSLGELLRGDLGPLDAAVLGELAERAGTPVLAEALRRHLPAMLRVVEPPSLGPATARALPQIERPVADGRAEHAG